ncbi:MAG: lytic transglycosylase domain-containing protein [Streptosporangiaceae bacterium]
MAVAVPALALGAVTAGALAATPAAGHAPAQHRARQAVAAPAIRRAGTASGRTARLDGYAQPLAGTSGQASGARGGGGAPVRRHRAGHLGPRQIARRMLHRFGWSRRQFKYLDWLWNRESSWNVYASNPYSGAYGIPQAVPGSKMASAGPRWRTSARVQIRWGLRYIREVYGSPRQAWDHEVGSGWYGKRIPA